MPFLDPVRLMDGYDAYNRALRAVARATGTILVEGEERIPGDPEHFADTVHFRDPGNALQAQRVLEGLLGSSAYRDFIAARRDGRH